LKKLFSLVLAISLMPVMNAFALNYTQRLDNKTTFETLEEAHANGPAYLSGATGRTYVPDPALDTYPKGTTYVYRSARLFSPMSAGFRMNTNILVYTDKTFANKDAVLAYLKGLGLTDIIEKATGSVVLVTPINAKTGFGSADQFAYYQLQSAMNNLGYSKRPESGGAAEPPGQGRPAASFYADNTYFGGLTYRYVIGIDAGATFLNNYVASTFDSVSRIAGLLLVNGGMERINKVAAFVPAYLVNAPDDVIEKYKAANNTDASGFDGSVNVYYNQAQPLQKVVTNKSAALDAALVRDVYSNFLTKAMRVPVVKAGLNVASAPYGSYNWNQTPYSLSERNPVVDGATPDGLTVTEHKEDRFRSMATDKGEYLQYWLEVLPKEVRDGTAPKGTVPLILATHGGGDDPLQYLDEVGLLALSGKERFGIVAPFHSNITNELVSQVMPKLVKYMLDTYPALDASRVYSTGYSMGGGASILSVLGDLGTFAAAVPEGAVARYPAPELKSQFGKVRLPVMFITSTYDFYILNDKEMSDGSTNPLADHQGMVNMFLEINGMKKIAYDFNTYRYFGAKADVYRETRLNNEYTNRMWLLKNDKGVPMVGYSVTDFLVHGLYPEYSKLAWEFMKHYSRDRKTGEIVYTPYAK
jgi:hypothetical protein